MTVQQTTHKNNQDQESALGVDCSRNIVSDSKPYQKPLLTVYGDVRDITLGTTVGMGESGCDCVFRSGSNAMCPVICP